MKERVTLTIDEDLLLRVDKTIDKETIKNRSHAIEVLLRKVLRGKVPQTAVILAGGTNTGKGARCMLEVQGKPVLQHNIELLQRAGITDIILAIGSHTDIFDFFQNGTKLGVRISYVEEKVPLGTAGCLRLLKERLTKPFLMLNGDELKDIDIERLFDAHNQYESTATIALTTSQKAGDFGVAILDGNHILRFMEKPNDAQSMLINAGMYVLEPSVCSMVPEGFSMLEQDIFPVLAREGKLFGYPFSGKWFSMKTDDDKKRAEENW